MAGDLLKGNSRTRHKVMPMLGILWRATPVLMRNIRVQGVLVGSREMFGRMNAAIGRHGLRPVVDRVFPFAEAPNAFRHLASGAHVGKVVVVV